MGKVMFFIIFLSGCATFPDHNLKSYSSEDIPFYKIGKRIQVRYFHGGSNGTIPIEKEVVCERERNLEIDIAEGNKIITEIRGGVLVSEAMDKGVFLDIVRQEASSKPSAWRYATFFSLGIIPSKSRTEVAYFVDVYFHGKKVKEYEFVDGWSTWMGIVFWPFAGYSRGDCRVPIRRNFAKNLITRLSDDDII